MLRIHLWHQLLKHGNLALSLGGGRGSSAREWRSFHSRTLSLAVASATQCGAAQLTSSKIALGELSSPIAGRGAFPRDKCPLPPRSLQQLPDSPRMPPEYHWSFGNWAVLDWAISWALLVGICHEGI